MTEPFLSAFLDSVRRTGLLAEEAVQTFTDEFRSQPPTSREELASRLVERGVLTPYQAERLLQGMPEDVVLAERYHLLEKIGSGGMGAVFRARDTRLNRIVAIKVMAPQHLSQPDAVERFKREARLLAQLTLPNIVQAFDSGEDRGRNFLVMEYVQGVGLEKVLREKGKIAPTIAADYIYQTALGMERAHARGLIHRDLKPANLLLTREGEIKILDLGLARFVQDQVPDQLTRENIGMGTPDYMPPEQFRDAHSVDPRADIYSLGCTLYHLISGLVPFPGSSFSEKARAHENKEPPPLVERCPEIPAGLEMAISKMMAKRLGDRHQTMGEVVEALAPYVASSSLSLPKVTQTLTWQGRKLASATRRSKARLLTAALVIALVGAMVGWGLPRMLRQEEPKADSLARREGADGSDKKASFSPDKPADPRKTKIVEEKGAEKTDKGMDDEKPPAAKPDDKKAEKKPAPKLITIPNGITVAQDGSGDCNSIQEAIRKIQAGQTIRVLDDGTYVEAVEINRKQHAGITLEALKNATIKAPPGMDVVHIRGVPGVTLRGFKLRADDKNSTLIFVTGKCPGTVIENIHFSAAARESVGGIVFAGMLAGEDAVGHIRDNSFHDLAVAIAVFGSGVGPKYSTASPSGRLRIENNDIIECRDGLILQGCVRQVQVAGNRIVWCSRLGLQLENLLEGAGDILFANNTVLESAEAFRLWDNKVGGEKITFANNLFLGTPGKDMVFHNSDGSPDVRKGFGDGKAVRDRWTFLHNWREQQAGADLLPGSIPPGRDDQVLPKISIQSRRREDKGFLDPGPESPLATKGAGKAHAAFPSHVGAVVPAGAAEWRWQWTWDAYFERKLTVAQDAKAGARFTSVRAAVDALRPGWTIQINDEAVYRERLSFDDPARHGNTTVDAVKGAVIELDGEVEAIHVHGVPGVTLRGLKLQAKSTPAAVNGHLIHIEGACPGTLVEKIVIKTGLEVNGVYIRNTALPLKDPPVVVRDCDIQTGGVGVVLSGVPETPARNIVVCDNEIKAPKGLAIEIYASDVLLAGNVIQGGLMAGIELRGLYKDCQGILIANNSCFGGQVSLRVWDDVAPALKETDVTFKEGQVELLANVLVRATLVDMVLINARKQDTMEIFGQASGDLLKLWRFESNWRDMKGELIGPGTPLAKQDHVVKEKMFVSLSPSNDGFLKPNKEEKGVASGGLGPRFPEFPSYAGAVPPPDLPRWDWEKMWAARREKR